MLRRPAVFIDRDGTLINERGYLSDPNKLHIYKHAAPALKKLQEAGFYLIVITNQSGIARGLFSEKTLFRIHSRLKALLKQNGVFLSKIYHCPHLPEAGCICRKPKPGLVHKATREFNIDLSCSYMVGDQDRDIHLATNVGIKPILVLTGFGRSTRKAFGKNKLWVSKDLLAAANRILNG